MLAFHEIIETLHIKRQLCASSLFVYFLDHPIPQVILLFYFFYILCRVCSFFHYILSFQLYLDFIPLLYRREIRRFSIVYNKNFSYPPVSTAIFFYFVD